MRAQDSSEIIFLNTVTSVKVKNSDVQRCIHCLVADIQMTDHMHNMHSFAQWATYAIADAPELDMLESKEPTWHGKNKYKSALINSRAFSREHENVRLLLHDSCVRPAAPFACTHAPERE